MLDLDTVVAVPFQPQDDLDDNEIAPLRLDAYTEAWSRCLERIKAIVTEVYSPVLKTVLDCLDTVHSNRLSGLPFPELPVITVSDFSGGSLFLELLGTGADSDDYLATHVHPADCPNVPTAMKYIISRFVDRDDGTYIGSHYSRRESCTDLPKRKGAVLAPFDVELLRAWYKRTQQTTQLVVFLHDFEQFERRTLQDVLYIFSLHIETVPVAFVFLLSSPSPSTYLQAFFPRSTLTILRPYHFVVPAGRPLLDAILFQTFFDPTFNLTFIPGPRLLDYIEEHYETHNASLDSLISALQIAHLHHFTTTRLSFLAETTPSFTNNAARLRFTKVVLGNLNLEKNPKKQKDRWLALAASPAAFTQAIDDARDEVLSQSRDTKLAFALLRIVLDALQGRREKLIGRWRGVARISRALAEGHSVNGLSELLKKLSHDDLVALVAALHDYFQSAPYELRQAYVQLRSHIVALRSAAAEGTTGDIAEVVEGMIRKLFKPFNTTGPFWGVWYTGENPFPQEAVDPSVRSSLVSGLSNPQAFVEVPEEKSDTLQDEEDDDGDDTQALPDTSILFRGYLKAGKMINVYDWFDAFRVVLEAQRQRKIDAAKRGASDSVKRKGKKPANGVEDEDDEEKWRMSVQARFIRAVHELDMLGFIRHTSRGGGGRKGEYVMRTTLGLVE
ncbi:Origin recognition complex subunit 3-like [Mycena chlorophos]|uniref:Origin recognition complex subunit 3-like n=1 Tax=Mycena chlorophos TaxID=658473 RepID=A0A8H6VNT9_MYCCL|nr:Origin recognition complex subunit 3-like [Mycena chlorophos]